MVNKILFYEASSGFGGSASALVNIINHLDRRRFYPVVVIKNYGAQIDKIKNVEIVKLRDYIEADRLSGFNFILYFIKNIIPEVAKLWFIIKTKKISLVHININVIVGIPAIIASKIAGVPCICHIRETRELIKREKFFVKWVNKFLILNKNAYEIHKQDIPHDKLEIIYDGIDLDEFNEVNRGILKKEYNIGSAPVVGVVGRVVEGKGQKEFVLAVKESLKFKPNSKFVIIGDTKSGDSKYYDEVKELTSKEKLTDNVIFTGWRNDIKNIVPDLDILVLQDYR